MHILKKNISNQSLIFDFKLNFMRETILQNLKKYDYDFELNGKNTIRVKLNLNLHVIINLTDEKVKFENQLMAWNPLSGIFEISLEKYLKRMVFWMVIIIVLFALFVLTSFDSIVYLYNIAILFTALIYTCIASTYFFITYESFKTKVMLWLK